MDTSEVVHFGAMSASVPDGKGDDGRRVASLQSSVLSFDLDLASGQRRKPVWLECFVVDGKRAVGSFLSVLQFLRIWVCR